MKITVMYGETTVQISGKDSLKNMKKAVKEIIKALPTDVHPVEEEEEPNPVGFVAIGATVERATEVEYIYDEDYEEEELEFVDE